MEELHLGLALKSTLVSRLESLSEWELESGVSLVNLARSPTLLFPRMLPKRIVEVLGRKFFP